MKYTQRNDRITKVTMTKAEFIEKVYEIAFGDDAINKGFTPTEVIEKLKEYSENAWKYEELSK